MQEHNFTPPRRRPTIHNISPRLFHDVVPLYRTSGCKWDDIVLREWWAGNELLVSGYGEMNVVSIHLSKATGKLWRTCRDSHETSKIEPYFCTSSFFNAFVWSEKNLISERRAPSHSFLTYKTVPLTKPVLLCLYVKLELLWRSVLLTYAAPPRQHFALKCVNMNNWYYQLRSTGNEKILHKPYVFNALNN